MANKQDLGDGVGVKDEDAPEDGAGSQRFKSGLSDVTLTLENLNAQTPVLVNTSSSSSLDDEHTTVSANTESLESLSSIRDRSG